MFNSLLLFLIFCKIYRKDTAQKSNDKIFVVKFTQQHFFLKCVRPNLFCVQIL